MGCEARPGEPGRARPTWRHPHGSDRFSHAGAAGRSPSGVPCLPRQRIKGFESRSEQDDCYICGSICDAERESHEEPARADHGARRGHAGGHADLPGPPLLHLGQRAAVGQALSRLARSGRLMRIRQGVYMRPIESRFGRCAPGIEKSPQALSELWRETIAPERD